MNADYQSILLVTHDANGSETLVRAFRSAQVTNPIHVLHRPEVVMDYLTGKADYSDREKYPLPQLLLVESSLHGGTVWDLARSLRQNGAARELPMIVLTDTQPTQEQSRVAESDAFTCELKPRTFDALVQLAGKIAGFWLKPMPAQPSDCDSQNRRS